MMILVVSYLSLPLQWFIWLVLQVLMLSQRERGLGCSRTSVVRAPTAKVGGLGFGLQYISAQLLFLSVCLFTTSCFYSTSSYHHGASRQHRYSSVIKRSIAVASSMFSRRARAGSAKARRAGANGARIEARSERHCHFIAPAPSRKHQALSALCHCRSRNRAFSSIRSECARSTKDRKKGYAYDPGALI